MTRAQRFAVLLIWSCAQSACNSHKLVPIRSDAATSAPITEADAGSTSPDGGQGPADAAGAAPVAIEDLCPLFTKDLCTYLMQCGHLKYRDLDHCTSDLDCFGMQELLAAAKSGAVIYDPAQVGACHARFVAAPCDFAFFMFTPDIFEVLSYCPGTLIPKIPAGGACLSGGECVDGLYCHKGVADTCPGICRVPAQAGESCADNARCAHGLSCEGGQCEAPVYAKAGDPCPDGRCPFASFSCPANQICRDDLWCDRVTATCKLGLLEGETCGMMTLGTTSYLANCASGLWCDNPGLATGICRKPSALGGPCGWASYSCQSGLHCSGYVSGAKTVQLGTCVGPLAVGGDCSRDTDCQTGLVCNSNTCKPPSPSSEACLSDSTCASGLVCQSGLCQAPRYPGDPCDDTHACTFGRCMNGTCRPHAKVGQPCLAPGDCATGSCVKDLCYDNSVCHVP
jgi:hypothetical protein